MATTPRAAHAISRAWRRGALHHVRATATLLGRDDRALSGQFRRWDRLAGTVEAVALGHGLAERAHDPARICADLDISDHELAERLHATWHGGHGIEHCDAVRRAATALDAAWARLTGERRVRLARLELEACRFAALRRGELTMRLLDRTLDDSAAVYSLEEHVTRLVADGHDTPEVLRRLRRWDRRRLIPADQLEVCAELLTEGDRAARRTQRNGAGQHVWLLVRSAHPHTHPAARLQQRGNRIRSCASWTPLGLSVIALSAHTSRRDGDGHLLRLPAGLASRLGGEVEQLDRFDVRLAELTVELWERGGLDARHAYDTAVALGQQPDTTVVP